jgi:hypothetical protein
MSVSELRQWLASVSEKHQSHFQKGQVSKRPASSKEHLRQHDSRKSNIPLTQESPSSTIAKEPPKQEHAAHSSAKLDNQVEPKRRVVSYNSEYPAWNSRKHQKEKGRRSSAEEHSPKEIMVPKNSPRKLEANTRDTSRRGARRSSSATGESSKNFAAFEHSNPKETITFHRESYDSTHASTNAFSTANSTLFSDCFADQMDLKDHWVTKREERLGRKSRLVQDRQRALQEKWAQDRQTVIRRKSSGRP